MAPSADGASTSLPRPSHRSHRSARASRTSGSPGSPPPRLGLRALRDLAARHGIEPSRDLGQHFLADPNLAKAIVSEADVDPGTAVLEIGAGLGSLTLPLAERAADVGARVLAIEFDRALIPALREVVGGCRNVEIRQDDALSARWEQLLGTRRWTVVSNLPYNVATPVLLRLLERAAAIDRAVMMVQKEVAERLSAGPGDGSYGPTALRVAYRAEAEIIRAVPSTVFWPRPHVDSAVVRLRPRAAPVGVDATELFRVVDGAFAERRKTMRSALRRLGVPQARVAEVLRRAEIEEDARPESLALERFVAVAQLLREEEASDG